MAHVMIDLETLGTRPGCAIASVGACVFSMKGIGNTFYGVVDIATTSMLSIDASTVKWWFEQSHEAQAVFRDPNMRPLIEVLKDFRKWFDDNGGVQVWGHGASFDAPILETAFYVRALEPPFTFAEMRDTRTVYDLTGVYPDRSKGLHHHALHDAIVQAEAVIVAAQKLGIDLDNLPR